MPLGQIISRTMTDPTETDFIRTFDSEIAPHLEALEQARRHEVLRLRRRAAAFAALVLGWLTALLIIGHPLLWIATPPLAAIGLFITLQLRASPGLDYGQALRATILPPLCAFAGGWRHERLENRDIFSKGEIRVEPDWPLFTLPDWHMPIQPHAQADITRLLTLLASPTTPAYPVPPGDPKKEPQVTS
jgi:hypothetical protein